VRKIMPKRDTVHLPNLSDLDSRIRVGQYAYLLSTLSSWSVDGAAEAGVRLWLRWTGALAPSYKVSRNVGRLHG
jgi:hypothetical protein